MADAPPAYDLRAPAAARGESITSQLQREILGDAASALEPARDAQRLAQQMQQQQQQPIQQTTPTSSRKTRSSDDAELVALSTPEPLSQGTTQPLLVATTATFASDDRRRTLSPSKALAFFNQEGITDSVMTASRRDTVSPEAIRSMLNGLGDSDTPSRRASVASALGVDPASGLINDDILNDYRRDVARTKQQLESSKLALMQPSGKRRRSSAGGSTAKTKNGKQAPNDQDSFTDAFFSSNLLSRDDDDDDDNTIDSVSEQAAAQRRATLDPMDVESMLADAQLGLVLEGAEDDTNAVVGRQQQRASPSTNTRGRKRRATLDPADLLAMSDAPAFGAIAATVNANRRDTIGDGDLLELRREYGVEPPATAEESTRRKAKSPSPPARDAGRRHRLDKASVSAATSKSTPVKRKAVALEETDSLFSPTPTNRTNKTPLKSCLSARKAKRSDQSTPNKSVNFGPSQGAEFNLGSPSTSMTPMPARDARVMFPLHEKSPPASDDDEETSLNTSILDEIDGQDESDDDLSAALLDQRKQSLEPSVSMRTRRSYSSRGVSPLDTQANARRQRRLSTAAGSTQQQESPLVSARNRRAFEAAAAVAAAKAAALSNSSAVPTTSFLSGSDPNPQSRLAYADSSASSDEGEDMEITGDFSNQAATAATIQTGVRRNRLSESPRRSLRIGSRHDSLFVDSPLADETMELGTLKDLVAEAYEDEERKEEGERLRADSSDFLEDDDTLQLGSLSDLAREGEDEDEDEDKDTGTSSSQEKNLDPIVEGDDEDRRSSSAHSMMSLDSEDESDDVEYDAKRKSLVVNLSSKFERFGSGTPKSRTQQSPAEETPSKKPQREGIPSPSSRALPSPSPQKLPDLLLVEEVIARITFESMSREAVESVNLDLLRTEVQRSCATFAALSDLRFSTNEISSWCNGLTDSLPSLSREKLSRLFSADDSVTLTRLSESIQGLQSIESVHVRGGYCQWRSKLEKRVCDSLVQCENKLNSDVKTVRSMLESDRSHRDNELRLIKQQMERERQMEQLLDGIEEQQAVQREYQSSVRDLESACSSLSLEASVLDHQLISIELSTPTADRSDASELKLRGDVLELEEMLAVRENLGMWQVLSATMSSLVLVSQFDDVFFSVDVRVSVDVGGASQEPNFKVVPTFTKKTQQKKMTDGQSEHEEGDDVVSTIASTILSQQQLKVFESTSTGPALLSKHLLSLSATLIRAYQHLRELRSISTAYEMRLEGGDNERKLWIEFIRFPRALSGGGMVGGLKFSVGHPLSPQWPYTDLSSQVRTDYGTVTEEKLRQQLNQVSTQVGHEHLTRVCRRLHDVFIRDVCAPVRTQHLSIEAAI